MSDRIPFDDRLPELNQQELIDRWLEKNGRTSPYRFLEATIPMPPTHEQGRQQGLREAYERSLEWDGSVSAVWVQGSLRELLK